MASPQALLQADQILNSLTLEDLQTIKGTIPPPPSALERFGTGIRNAANVVSDQSIMRGVQSAGQGISQFSQRGVQSAGQGISQFSQDAFGPAAGAIGTGIGNTINAGRTVRDIAQNFPGTQRALSDALSPEGSAPSFMKKGNFGKRVTAEQVPGEMFGKKVPGFLRGAAAGALNVTGAPYVGPVARGVAGVGAPLLDALTLATDVIKGGISTLHNEQALELALGDDSRGKFLSNIKREQDTRARGGREELYNQAIEKIYSPENLDKMLASGVPQEEIAKKMANDIAWIPTIGGWSDLLTDIVALEGLFKLPGYVGRIIKGAKRKETFKFKTQKRKLQLAERAERDAALARKKAGTPEAQYQAKLKQKFDALSPEEQAAIQARPGPIDPAQGLKKEILLERDLSSAEDVAGKMRLEGGVQRRYGEELDRLTRERRKQELGRKLFQQKEPVISEGPATPKPSQAKKAPKIFQQKEKPVAKPQAAPEAAAPAAAPQAAATSQADKLRAMIARLEAGGEKGANAAELRAENLRKAAELKKRLGKISEKSSVRTTNTVEPAPKAPSQASQKGNKIKQGAAKGKTPPPEETFAEKIARKLASGEISKEDAAVVLPSKYGAGNKIKQGAAKAADDLKVQQVARANEARIVQLEKRIESLDAAGTNAASKADNAAKAAPLRKELAKLKGQKEVPAAKPAPAAAPQEGLPIPEKPVGNKIKQAAKKATNAEEAAKLRAAAKRIREQKVSGAGAKEAMAENAKKAAELEKRAAALESGKAAEAPKKSPFKKKSEKPAVKEPEAPSAAPTVEKKSTEKSIVELLDDLGIQPGLSTKDTKGLNPVEIRLKQETSKKEIIRRLNVLKDTRLAKAIVKSFKTSAEVNFEDHLKNVLKMTPDEIKSVMKDFPLPPPSVRKPLYADDAFIALTKGERLQEVFSPGSILEGKSLPSLLDPISQAEAMDVINNARVIEAIRASSGVKRVKPAELVQNLRSIGKSDKEIMSLLVEANTSAESMSRTAGITSKGEVFLKKVMQVITGKKQPLATLVDEPFSQNILEKSAGKNIVKPSVRKADSVGLLSEEKKLFPSKGKSVSKAEKIKQFETPGKPSPGPERPKGVPAGVANLPDDVARPREKWATKSIGDMDADEIREYSKWKQGRLKEQRKIKDSANEAAAKRRAELDKDSKIETKVAQKDAQYDHNVKSQRQAEKAAYKAEQEYYIEEQFIKEINGEIQALKSQLGKIRRAKGRGVYQKTKPIQQRLDELVLKRDEIRKTQNARISTLGREATLEAKFQSTLAREKVLKERLPYIKDADEAADIRMQLQGLKLEQENMINKMAGSQQMVDEIKSMGYSELIKEAEIKAEIAKRLDDTGFMSVKDVSGTGGLRPKKSVARDVAELAEDARKRALANLARRQAARYEVNKIALEFGRKAAKAGKTVEEYMKGVKDAKGKPAFTQVEIRDTVRLNSKLAKMEAKREMVGNLGLARKVAKGQLHPDLAIEFKKLSDEVPNLIGKKRVLKTVEQKAAMTSIEARKVFQAWSGLPDAEAAGMFQVPWSDLIFMADRGLQTGMAPHILKEEMIRMMHTFDRTGTNLARAMQARGHLVGIEPILQDLRKSMKLSTSREETQGYLDMINMVKRHKDDPSTLSNIYDMYHEYSVNAILSAGVTHARNIVGATTEVFVHQPADRVFRAMLSQTYGKWAPKLSGGKLGSNELVYFREIIPEIKALYYNLPEGLEVGSRFFIHGNTQGVLNSIEKEMKFWNKLNASRIGGRGKSNLMNNLIAKRKSWILRQNESLVEIKAGVRTGEVFTGGEASAIIGAGARITDTSNSLLMKSLGYTVQGAGYAANTPVRALVGADAVLMNASFKAHKAAALTNKRIQLIKRNPGSKLVTKKVKVTEFGKTEVKKIKQVVSKNGEVLIDDVSQMTLNSFEIAQARTDALYYMYRREFQSPFGKKLEKVLRTRGLNNVILFAKTRTNILKNAADASPFGILTNVFPESIKASKDTGRILLDGKSTARVIRGTLFMTWMDYMAKQLGGRFVGPSKTPDERQRRQARRLPELYYEEVAGRPEFGVHPLSNQAPLTNKAAQVAMYQEWKENVEKGYGFKRRSGLAFDSLIKAIAEDSMYADMQAVVRAMEAWGAEPEDPNDIVSEKNSRMFGRYLSSRLAYNFGRETKQSGKILGIDIPGIPQDNTVVEPDTGDPLKNIGQTILHDVLVFGKSPGVGRRVSFLTGENIQRTPRYSPGLQNALGYFHPYFLPKGYKPDALMSPGESDVGRMLEAYNIALPQAPGSITVAGGRIVLTSKEQHDFVRNLSSNQRSKIFGTTMERMIRITKKVGLYEKSGMDFTTIRSKIQKGISKIKEDEREVVKSVVVRRLMSDKAGRTRLWEKIHRDRVPYQDTPQQKRRLKLLLLKDSGRLLKDF